MPYFTGRYHSKMKILYKKCGFSCFYPDNEWYEDNFLYLFMFYYEVLRKLFFFIQPESCIYYDSAKFTSDASQSPFTGNCLSLPSFLSTAYHKERKIRILRISVPYLLCFYYNIYKDMP